jgi:glycerophosphoryl diester phosphodiesterase
MRDIAALAFLLLPFAGLAAAQKADPKVEIIAHRGASYDAPENTLAAINLAWKQKSDASEFDVFLSKDGKIVVIHDRDTLRTTGVEMRVADTSLADLRKLDAGKWGKWKDGGFAGEKIPTLEEMLATVPRGKRVLIEVKCGVEIVPELRRVLKASKLKPEQTPIISFHADVIAAVKKARPDLAAYWIVSLDEKKKKAPDAETLIATAREIKADGLDLSASPKLDAAYADKVKKAGLKLYVWTVNDVKVARQMVQIGVDGITTDRPGWLREELAK